MFLVQIFIKNLYISLHFRRFSLKVSLIINSHLKILKINQNKKKIKGFPFRIFNFNRIFT